MTKLHLADIQGFIVRGYNYPLANNLFLVFGNTAAAQQFLETLLPQVTTAESWHEGKPQSTVNVAFSHPGLDMLGVPADSLLTFPLEYVEGMRARAAILGDTGPNAPERWDEVWRQGRV
ncbi:MAG: Dyp-type peroxidase, partial [Bryobacteraceae bacterium]